MISPTNSEEEQIVVVPHEPELSRRMQMFDHLRELRYRFGDYDTLMLNHYLFGTRNPEDVFLPINLWDET